MWSLNYIRPVQMASIYYLLFWHFGIFSFGNNGLPKLEMLHLFNYSWSIKQALWDIWIIYLAIHYWRSTKQAFSSSVLQFLNLKWKLNGKNEAEKNEPNQQFIWMFDKWDFNEDQEFTEGYCAPSWVLKIFSTTEIFDGSCCVFVDKKLVSESMRRISELGTRFSGTETLT